eukprot:TRINITY_DN7415_c0_g1_i1.p1 TRINITY_DN7415_c0_g1~~TRINITY_DN7415_c0_g1_i1.p1  ORF type:complete len:429 (+),score=48.66 TRINITY_DN7415_c0_g1_i1:15-1301(+)
MEETGVMDAEALQAVVAEATAAAADLPPEVAEALPQNDEEVTVLTLNMLDIAAQRTGKERSCVLADLLHRLATLLPDGQRRYELLGLRLVQNAANRERCFHLLQAISSNPMHPMLFALALHQWAAHEGGHSDSVVVRGGLSRWHIVRSGLQLLFWDDIQQGSMHYKPLYLWLRDTGLAAAAHPVQPGAGKSALSPLSNDLLSLIARYFFHYSEDATDIEIFVCTMEALTDALQPEDLDAKGGEVAPKCTFIDIFVREVCLQAQALQRPESLALYLQKFVHLNAVLPRANAVYRERLYHTLYSLSTAGGPRYSPRNVRTIARNVLYVLCPQGRRTRVILNSLFRIFHQHYFSWAKSATLYFARKIGDTATSSFSRLMKFATRLFKKNEETNQATESRAAVRADWKQEAREWLDWLWQYPAPWFKKPKKA